MKEPITTTLAKIRAHYPCEDGWKKLYKSLGGIKNYGEHTPIKFSQILESNGLNDSLWCLRTICPEHDKDVRLYAADCAGRVLHIYEEEYQSDDRPRKAIQAARDFANGLIGEDELAAARASARDAAEAAARSDAWAAARSDAWAAARAARDAWAAAWAARASARAARDAWAALDAEIKIQEQMFIERFG